MLDTITIEITESANTIKACESLVCEIEAAAKLTIAAFRNGGRLYLAGNGGSAALAQHLAAELVGRYRLDRLALPAFCLTDNQAALTAIANDFGYDKVFRRQLAMASPGDVVWLFTTSGKSANVLIALIDLRRRGVPVIAFTGAAGLHDYAADVVLAVPSDVTSRVQDAHGVIGHVLCGLIECGIFTGEEALWLKYR
jgi:D-sedoheptulose 7-phosphate isomerase